MLDNKRIILRLKGGLGNQLFQLSAAMQLQDKIGGLIVCDISSLNSYKTKREYTSGFVSEIFNTMFDGSPTRIERLVVKSRLPALLRLKTDLISFYSSSIDIAEGINSSQLIFLDGYFQDKATVFNNTQSTRLKNMLFKQHQELLNGLGILRNDYLGLHIRRGDFMVGESVNIYRHLSDDYFTKNIDFFKDKKIFVFSDDPICSRNFARSIGATDVSSLGLSLIQEFVLFAYCGNKILSNSTFSWWADFIGQCDNGLTIMPRLWFIDEKQQNNFEATLLMPRSNLLLV